MLPSWQPNAWGSRACQLRLKPSHANERSDQEENSGHDHKSGEDFHDDGRVFTFHIRQRYAWMALSPLFGLFYVFRLPHAVVIPSGYRLLLVGRYP